MIKTRIALRELDLEARRLQRQLTSSSTQLHSLLGGSQVPTKQIIGKLHADFPEVEIESLRTAVREGHPAVLASRKDAEAAERRFDQTKSERIPDSEIRLAYGRDAATDEDFVEAGISLPLPLFDRGQGNILESQHLAAKARRDTEALVNALLADLAQRGLLEHTLVAWVTEFGRMPTFQKGASGRDHNPKGFTCWLAGAGVKAPFSYGATDEFGYHAVQDKSTVYDLWATVLHLLGLDHEALTYRFGGRDLRLTDVHGHVLSDICA